jgi:hypothetical protein
MYGMYIPLLISPSFFPPPFYLCGGQDLHIFYLVNQYHNILKSPTMTFPYLL